MQAAQVMYAYTRFVDLLPCLSDMLAAYLSPKAPVGECWNFEFPGFVAEHACCNVDLTEL